MKAISPIGTTEPGISFAIDLFPALLRIDAFSGKHGVIIVINADYLVRINPRGTIEAHAVSLLGNNSLQNVHVIAQAWYFIILTQLNIPA